MYKKLISLCEREGVCRGGDVHEGHKLIGGTESGTNTNTDHPSTINCAFS